MRVRGKLHTAELEEVRWLLQSKWYLRRILLRGWPSFLVLMALLWGTIAKLIVGDHKHWLSLSITWTVVALIAAWAILSSQRSQSHALQDLNRDLPKELVVNDQGIHGETADGVTYHRPWSKISAWRKGDAVDILSLEKRHGFVFIPLCDLSPQQREKLDSLLRQNVGEPQTAE